MHSAAAALARRRILQRINPRSAISSSSSSVQGIPPLLFTRREATFVTNQNGSLVRTPLLTSSSSSPPYNLIPSVAFSTTPNDNDSSTKDDEDDTDTTTNTSPEAETMTFQAETRQLLDIVTHSLYTDKEIFLRELVSNASDALEKLRHVQSTGNTNIVDAALPLEIRIETDELAQTITVRDTGIGLNKQEMMDNLGTIARSGSKAFVKALSEQQSSSPQAEDATAGQGIIGKFGVGFYSAFMIGSKVEVRSLPAIAPSSDTDTDTPYSWTSEGTGSYQVAPLSSAVRQNRGSSVVVHVKDEELQFVDDKRIESILKKYSNFVNFPIFLNGTRVNTMEAVWAVEPKQVTDETHEEFYKFISNAFDVPLSTLHFRADAPLEIKALFYVPSFHTEKHGMGRLEPGVGLYSRKVLIEAKSKDILPDWLRFVKGVVDSEDLPLSLSREKPQDTALVGKLRRALTRKMVNHLTTMARKEPDKYKHEFYNEYSFFLKEGVCQDYEFQEALSKILYFETSKTMDGELSSFDDYIARCTPEQQQIYYLCAPSRKLALASPYLETFEKSGTEVILVYSAIDDFVMSNLAKYSGRELVSAEKGNITNKDDDDQQENDDDDTTNDGTTISNRLTSAQSTEFCTWFTKTIDLVGDTKTTNRLTSSPAVVTDHESGALRRMMRMVDTQDGGAGRGSGGGNQQPLAPQTVEINPRHAVVVGLYHIRLAQPELAKVCAEQVFDNCLVAAGLLDDGRTMLPRLNDLLESLVKGASVSAKQENIVEEVEEVASTQSETKQQETVVEAEFTESKK